MVAKWTKSKTVYKEAEDLKLVAAEQRCFRRFFTHSTITWRFFFSRSQSQQRIRSTSIIFGANFLFPIITEHPDNYQAFIDFTLPYTCVNPSSRLLFHTPSPRVGNSPPPNYYLRVIGFPPLLQIVCKFWIYVGFKSLHLSMVWSLGLSFMEYIY